MVDDGAGLRKRASTSWAAAAGVVRCVVRRGRGDAALSRSVSTVEAAEAGVARRTPGSSTGGVCGAAGRCIGALSARGAEAGTGNGTCRSLLGVPAARRPCCGRVRSSSVLDSGRASVFASGVLGRGAPDGESGTASPAADTRGSAAGTPTTGIAVGAGDEAGCSRDRRSRRRSTVCDEAGTPVVDAACASRARSARRVSGVTGGASTSTGRCSGAAPMSASARAESCRSSASRSAASRRARISRRDLGASAGSPIVNSFRPLGLTSRATSTPAERLGEARYPWNFRVTMGTLPTCVRRFGRPAARRRPTGRAPIDAPRARAR